MMSAVLAFGAMFLAMVMTSVGNLAVALTLSLSRGQSVPGVRAAFVASLAIMLGASMILGTGLGWALPSEGWLGAPVLAYGAYDGVRVWRTRSSTAQSHASGASLVAMFMILSIDTLAVLTPLFAEGHGAFRWVSLAGGAAAVIALDQTLMRLARATSVWVRGQRWMDFAGAIAMVLAGLYILLDTPTDSV